MHANLTQKKADSPAHDRASEKHEVAKARKPPLFDDLRPEAIAQRKIQNLTKNNPHAKHLAQLKEITNRHNQAKHSATHTAIAAPTTVMDPAVIQAIGWESLGRFNPRRYLPVGLYGYTPEQMLENGLAGPQVQAIAPAAAAVAAPPAAAEALAVPGSADAATDSTSAEAVAAPARRSKKRRKKKTPAETGAAKAVDESPAGDHLESDEKEGDYSSGDGWIEVSHRKKRSPESEALRAAKVERVGAIMDDENLKKWIQSPTTAGTRDIHGRGSSSAHDSEESAKRAAESGNIEGAISDLHKAIDERTSDPRYRTDRDRGHAGAVDFLRDKIEALRSISETLS